MTEDRTPDRHCPGCAMPVGPTDRFCEECGAELAVRRASSPDPTKAAPASGTSCVSCGGEDIDADRFCMRCGVRQPAPRDRVELDLTSVAGVSDRGLRHHRNEDAMALRRVRPVDGADDVVIVVCDGVSTSDRPDEAAQAAADSAADLLARACDDGDDLAVATRSAVELAASVVAGLAGSGPLEHAPACTYVSAVVTERTVTVGWVGDSRAYWLADPAGPTPSTCLTSDDSWAARMIATGRLGTDEAYADDRSHALVAWLGADAEEITPHVRTVEPGGPGVVLLCSDGLWNYAWDADRLAEQALPGALATPLAAARALTGFALAAGGHDNVTVVLVPFPPTRTEDGPGGDPDTRDAEPASARSSRS